MVQFTPSFVITVLLGLSSLVSAVAGASWLDWGPPINNALQGVTSLNKDISVFLSQAPGSTGAINAAVTVANDLVILGASINVAAATADSLVVSIGLPSINDSAVANICPQLQQLDSQSISILGNAFTSSQIFAAFKASPVFPSIQESLAQLNATYSAFDSTWVFVAPAGSPKSTASSVKSGVDNMFNAVRALYAF